MKEIRLNAFEMNCVGHQSPGLWAHPRDRSASYTDLDYWTGLAKTLERGKFDGIFLADVLGIYDVYGGSPDAALRHAVRYEIADEYMQVVYQLWEGSWEDGAALRDRHRRVFADPARIHRVQHEGRFYRVDAIQLSEPSPQRTPVLYQAGASTSGRT